MAICKMDLFGLIVMFFCVHVCISIDTISIGQYIQDPGSIKSPGDTYTLGFFSPNGSTNRYVGLWYTKLPLYNVLWVANREKPIVDPSGMMTISNEGNLVVLNAEKEILWSSNVTNSVTNATAKLLDTGNLVLNNANGETLWQSFDHMCDTFMPKMKLSMNARTNVSNILTSWKNPSDPSPGRFTIRLDPQNIPEVFILDGSRPYWRSGPWNGQFLIGIQDMDYSAYLDGFSLIDEKDGTFYLTFSFAVNVSYFYLKPEGELIQPYWNDKAEKWEIMWTSHLSKCDVYGKCGAFGVCDAKKSPICSCLEGFVPSNLNEWNRGNWSSGCVRRTPLSCTGVNITNGVNKKDGFLKMKKMKSPDFAYWTASLDNKCRDICLDNCSCIAYAYDTGIGCLFWSQELIDMQQFNMSSLRGVDLYVRLAQTELGNRKDYRLYVGIAAIIVTLLIFTLAYCIWRRIKNQSGNKKKGIFCFPGNNFHKKKSNKVEFQELQLFSFENVANATDNFSLANKLGEGGFGPVYRGKLLDGQEIAVKRLSRTSGQGLQEFVNEMEVISKVQHRNLVKLHGCCVEDNEKMLIYEYMPNRSLDAVLFDALKKGVLDWRKRFNIIDGICRGLLYLHRDSRLRIVHRDLKASNILLDEDLNPKISDFGMARIFGCNEDQANTRRVVGTYGYMAPEYAMHGRFSEKSDVFSFGILLLEIVSGKKNSNFHNREHPMSLTAYAWKLWNEKDILKFIDPIISDSCYIEEISRCIHVGLLCTQESSIDRPTISAVISMLNNEIVDLPTPKSTNNNMASSDLDQSTFSINEMSITVMEGR